MQELIVPYCERILTGAEPVNTLSNLCFAIAGLACMVLLVRSTLHWRSSGFITLLSMPILLIFIAAGSGLFHTHPTGLTHIIDVLPIGLFVLVALVILLTQHWQLSSVSTASCVLVWLVLTMLAAGQVQWLHGSVLYLPSLTALGLMAIVKSGLRGELLTITCTFAIALFFRSLDMPMCNRTEIGLHWVWHVLAAISGWLTFRACLQASLPNQRMTQTSSSNSA